MLLLYLIFQQWLRHQLPPPGGELSTPRNFTCLTICSYRKASVACRQHRGPYTPPRTAVLLSIGRKTHIKSLVPYYCTTNWHLSGWNPRPYNHTQTLRIALIEVDHQVSHTSPTEYGFTLLKQQVKPHLGIKYKKNYKHQNYFFSQLKLKNLQTQHFVNQKSCMLPHEY